MVSFQGLTVISDAIKILNIRIRIHRHCTPPPPPRPFSLP